MLAGEGQSPAPSECQVYLSRPERQQTNAYREYRHFGMALAGARHAAYEIRQGRDTARIAKDAPLAAEESDILTTLKTEGFVTATHKKWFGAGPEAGTSTATVMDLPTLN